MGLVRVGRPYVVALPLVLAVLAALLLTGVVHRNAPGPLTERQILAMETAALKRVKFPQNFVRVERGCTVARCYLVAAPSSQVAAGMPGLLRSSGVQSPGSLRSAEPVAALKAGHWSTDSRDPYVIACKTSFTSTNTPLTRCQDAARVGETLINVLVRPYEPCNKPSCAQTGKAEVLAWSVALPSND